MRLTLLVSLFFAVLTAHAATVSSVSVKATSATLTPGQTATLSCTATYTNGTTATCVSPVYTENQGGTVIYLSGATMTGFAFGSTVVTAAVSGVSGTLAVTVVPTAQENLGAIPATQMLSGVGFNVTPQNDWEFALAAAAGATHVRFQCGWSTAENQTPPPQNAAATTRYTLQSYCVSALASAQKYGLHPILIAAYGPPYHAILSLSVPTGAPAGATSLNVQFSSGVNGDTLASMKTFNDTILAANGAYITNIHSYAGGLITGITLTDATHATLTLASALTAALPASSTTLYTINEGLYPPPVSFNPSDPSILAYASYVHFLAQSIAAAGLTGQVEIWNEPPWADDPWDDRNDFYDVNPGPVSPGPQTGYLPNWGFAAALQQQPAPAGATYIWGGTEKSGANSVLDPQMQQNTGVAFTEPASSVTSESFHPYGNNPEDALWSAPCLAAISTVNNLYACNLFGLAGGNFILAQQESRLLQQSNPTWGVAHNITETGFGLISGDTAHQARFILRQLLGYQAAGVTPIDFYRLYDTSPQQFGFVNTSTQAALPAYTAVAGLMSDLAAIKNAPVAAYPTASLTSVTSYTGSFPLDTVHLVGARTGGTANSELLTLWQRSYAPTGSQWGTLSQPAAVPVTLAIPANSAAVTILDLVTRQAVPSTTSGQSVTFNVSDDPIEVLVEPRTSTAAPSLNAISIAPASTTIPLAGTVTYACTASFSDGSTAPCTSPTYSSSNTAVASISSNVATAKSVGSTQITATVAFAGASVTSTATAALSVAMPAVLTLSGLAHTYTGTPQAAVVTTTPAGLSHTLTYAGSSTPPTAAGSYPVVATITNPAYAPSPIAATLVIAQAIPSVSWNPATQEVGRGAAIGAGVIDATSSTPGAFSYTATPSAGSPTPITAGSLLAPGAYTLTSTLSPTDSVDFASVSRSLAFSVGSHSVFIANRVGTVASFFPDGSLQSPATTGGSLAAAVDASGNVWSINLDRASLSQFSPTGEWLANATGGGISAASALAIDGAGTLWIANGSGTLSALTGTGAPAALTPIASPNLNAPASLSVDASGSLWIANSGSNTVTEVLGIAAPVVAPTITAVTASAQAASAQ
jgi:hypothetical protein